ncbi:MAG: sialate O-acetylesterase [Planctomycetota bacterium]
MRRSRRCAGQAGRGKLKVFILAGQSNMEGYGSEKSLGYMAKDPATADMLKKIALAGGGYMKRDDVWVKYGSRKGPLELGYGARRDGGERKGRMFGPEYAFGIAMGDHFEDQVLLIKCCWGGAALAQQAGRDGSRKNDFHPPSSSGPDQTGPRYKQMLAEVSEVLGNPAAHFPGYNGKGYEIVGFLWFQGYNDQFKDRPQQYEKNLANFIRDVRKDFKVPDLPFVIGEFGCGGPNAKSGSGSALIREAQKAVAAKPEFKGNVILAETAKYWDEEANTLCRKGVWKTDPERFYAIASERPYHYLGSGKMMYQMGNSFGEGMIELLKKK